MQQISKVFSFFGPPGSGKGTLARQCEVFGIHLLSTGDLCRKHVALGDAIGKEVDSYLLQGHLVPDTLMMQMVKNWFLHEANDGKPVILDGFPRTKIQAQSFLEFLKAELPQVSFEVVVFTLPDKDILDRLAVRFVCQVATCQEVYNMTAKRPLKDGICDKCSKPLTRRNDDNFKVIIERLRIFPQYRNDLMDFYKKNGCNVTDFSVTGLSVQEVFEKFKKILVDAQLI